MCDLDPVHRACSLWTAVLLGCSAAGCYSVASGRSAVDRVDISGAEAIGSGAVEERIATAPSPRFLGFIGGLVYDYRYYDKYVLQRDIARIQRFYQARGFYDAQVRAARVFTTSEGHVRVEIVVEEGQPVLLAPVRLSGIEALPFQLQAAVVQAIPLRAGDRFDEDDYEQAKAAAIRELTRRGYAWADVHGQVQIDRLARQATIQLTIIPGPHFKIGRVNLTGHEGKLPEAPIRRALVLRPGREFSTDDLEAGKQALLGLGVFSDVDITWAKAADPAHPVAPLDAHGEPVMDLDVHVTPSLLRTLRLGAGGELDVLRTDVHGAIGWEDRNFLGGLRRFSINAKPGMVLFPTTLPTLRAPDRLLPESRIRADLWQPGLIEPRTNGILRGEFNVYPVLLRPINEDIILGYREVKGAGGFERNFWRNRVYSSLLVHAQANYPFTYHGMLDRTLGSVQLRFAEIETDLSFRDNGVRPHKGVFVGNNLQFAGGPMGGNIGDIKEQPDLRVYIPLARSVTLAARGSVGFLFPRNYGDALNAQAADPETLTRDVQLLYFRAFFSGGPNSNRGYPFRAIGPHGPAPFLSPSLSANQVLRDECNIYSPAYNDAVCAVPLGGLSLWEASLELRFPILGSLSGAVFTDSSDVSRQRTTLRFDYLHLSSGAGLRYDTPVGPVRFDVGVRIPGMQRLGGSLDPKVDGDPGTLLGIPMAVSIGVGETF